MDRKKQEQIISIIDDVDDMTIATVREDGFPQATTVSYMNEGLNIYFMTSADAQKSKNIEQNNKVSLTINRDYEDWAHIEGLSIGGLAIRVTDPEEMETVGTLLLNKFPQAADFDTDDEVELAFFRIEPKVISLLDYSKGFGYTETVEL